MIHGRWFVNLNGLDGHVEMDVITGLAMVVGVVIGPVKMDVKIGCVVNIVVIGNVA